MSCEARGKPDSLAWISELLVQMDFAVYLYVKSPGIFGKGTEEVCDEFLQRFILPTLSDLPWKKICCLAQTGLIEGGSVLLCGSHHSLFSYILYPRHKISMYP